ncbi:hypothetical protein HPC49_42950 [Pyxidicoccus fallax]|uniref:Immunity MXAN-0049 protein domain-containing protein n=1 Tax=Pyxidicoccus fallax TaxID=394095 RepID=A0A848LVY6_9BACT|nr:DUF1629 domain-containing protein [Pyxidicoccus fallax]NMO21444.1 hypothetical protein [Pyxidicoccus fallax]NPC84965.1 hypothetical protein [Pyxidicoccus fallax]
MSKRYFDLSDDLSIRGRWQLHSPVDEHGQEVDPWQFTKGQAVQVDTRLRLPLQVNGTPLDFTLGGLDTPVVSTRVAALLTELAPDDVQLLPVDIDGQTEPFRIVVATRLIRCIDDQASREVRYWKPEDGRPEKVGKYRVVSGLRIDPTQVGSARVFRPWGWTVALIVSEDIKQALERAGVTGTRFKEV